MKSKAGNTVQAVSVRIVNNITDGHMERVAVQRRPDSLIHDAEVFGMSQIGCLATGQIDDKITGIETCKQGHQTRRYPESPCARHGLRSRIQIEAIAPDRETLSPRR